MILEKGCTCFNMISVIRRSSTLAQNVIKNSSTSTYSHVYSKPPVSNLDDLNEYLLDNVIHNNEGKLKVCRDKMWLVLLIMV